MRVRCVNEGHYSYLTEGKTYKLKELGASYYIIVNNKHEKCGYPKKFFEIVEEVGENETKRGSKTTRR